MPYDLKTFTQNSSLHGISDLYYARSRVGRAAWVVLILGATSCAIYGCHGILYQYQQSPLYVNYVIRTSLQRDVPDVIICPFNRFDQRFIEQFNISSGLSEYMQLAFGLRTPYEFQKGFVKEMLKNKKHRRQLDALLKRQNWTFSDLIENASTPCEIFIKYCYSPTRPPGMKFFDCCKEARGILTAVGKCYRLPG